MVYRKYVKCPYCQKEISLAGIDMHVKMKHGENYKDFRSKFDELKKTAVGKQSVPKETKKEPPKEPAKESPKSPEPLKETEKGILDDLFTGDEADIEAEPPKPPRKAQGTKKTETTPVVPKGGEAPKEKSFLDRDLGEILDIDIL